MPWTLTPAAAAIAASAVAATGLTAVTVPTLLGQNHGTRAGGPALSIAVVEPREPVPVPGAIMDVGQVVDGYEHHPYVQPAAYDPAPYTWDNGPLPMPEPRVWTSNPEPMPPARVTVTSPQPRGDPSNFGFDEPLPDFAAARRERQARIDRIAAETTARTPSSSAVDPAEESVFY